MIYFDSAATTLQKPAAVSENMKRAVNRMSSPGRGGHKAAVRAADIAFKCRDAASDLFNVGEPENVVFTFNATHGLNIAIRSLVKPNSRVLISGYEHNSVVRPLKTIGVQIITATSEPFEPVELMHNFESKLNAGVDVVVFNHVSNVFGYVQPIYEISEMCIKAGVPVIIDASQSAGTYDIDMKKLGADFIAMPGHKGLYGPQGTGLLLCKDTGVVPETIMEGGTGSESKLEKMPEYLPDRLEAGTHNMPGISGLLAGIKFIKKIGIDRIRAHEINLAKSAVRGLSNLPGARVYSRNPFMYQSGVVSFNLWDMPCELVGEELDKRNIAVRAGMHCSPLAHESAGTYDTGTVRISFSAFNTEREVWTFLNAVEDISKKFTKK